MIFFGFQKVQLFQFLRFSIRITFHRVIFNQAVQPGLLV